MYDKNIMYLVVGYNLFFFVLHIVNAFYLVRQFEQMSKDFPFYQSQCLALLLVYTWLD